MKRIKFDLSPVVIISRQQYYSDEAMRYQQQTFQKQFKTVIFNEFGRLQCPKRGERYSRGVLQKIDARSVAKFLAASRGVKELKH